MLGEEIRSGTGEEADALVDPPLKIRTLVEIRSDGGRDGEKGKRVTALGVRIGERRGKPGPDTNYCPNWIIISLTQRAQWAVLHIYRAQPYDIF